MSVPALLPTQEIEANFWAEKRRIFNTSDPGTGKTRASLEGYVRSIEGRLLVTAPLTILRASWGDDIDKFYPGFSYVIAHGSEKKRRQAMESKADIVIINHDGMNWLEENRQYLKTFKHLVGDEFTVFKHRTRNRSKAMNIAAQSIPNLSLLSGTPNARDITDMWHPAFMVDQGARLGNNFYKFRSQVCAPVQVGPDPRMVEWREKPGAIEQVTSLLADITVRHELEGVPKNSRYNMFVDMPPAIMAAYKELERTAVLETQHGVITAINAGVKVKKMLQVLSGAAYDVNGNTVKVHTNRIDMVMDLLEARNQSLVAFNWKHERDALIEGCKKRGFSYDVIDGDISQSQKSEVVQGIVDRFQAGETKVILAHPQSAGHGLTLTAGTTTIWPSPTYNAEHFKQFNRRIDRRGQTTETETICICARNTREETVYENLNGKLNNMSSMLSLFSVFTQQAA